MVYTPWVNAMSAEFIRIEWSKKISNLSEVWILYEVHFFSESVYIFFSLARWHLLGSTRISSPDEAPTKVFANIFYK